MTLDRLSAKISAQALELKENNAKVTNYEKELARVSIEDCLVTPLNRLAF